MMFCATGIRPTIVSVLLAISIASIVETEAALAKDDVQKTSYTPNRQSFAIVSNGIVTSRILSSPNGLEVSSNAPGMITVASGSFAVSLRGDYVTLTGDVALAPVATPGVTVTANPEGGYTVVLDIPMEADLGR